MGVETLYHFTSRWALPRILREGLLRGDVPVSPSRGFMAPWLTSDPLWSAQDWQSGSFLGKAEVRITVSVDTARLQSWGQIVEKFDVSEVWSDAMVAAGGKRPGAEWFVHMGVVPVRQFTKWELRPGAHRPLDPTELPLTFAKIKNAGTMKRPGKTVWTSETRRSFIQRSENWVRSPDMQFPWSDMPAALLATLSRAKPAEASEAGVVYCEEHGIDIRGGVPDHPSYAHIDKRLAARMTMAGVGRWLNSRKRSIIDISAQGVQLLGAWEERFQGLPLVFRDPWRRGVMFRLETETLPLLVYVEPMEGEEAGVRYVMWVQDGGKRWGTVLPRSADGVSDVLDTYTASDRALGVKNKLAITADGARLDLKTLRRVCINALAAMHEDPSIILGSRKAPRKNRAKKAGPVNKVRRLTLSYDGARLVMRRWVILPTEPQIVKIKHGPHKSPCEHDVEPHYWRPWVNTPKADEKVLGTRTKTRVRDGKTTDYTQFRVKRWRGNPDGTPFKRGTGLKPRRARLVTGVSDLSLPEAGE
jgi:hypothetical protein